MSEERKALPEGVVEFSEMREAHDLVELLKHVAADIAVAERTYFLTMLTAGIDRLDPKRPDVKKAAKESKLSMSEAKMVHAGIVTFARELVLALQARPLPRINTIVLPPSAFNDKGKGN